MEEGRKIVMSERRKGEIMISGRGRGREIMIYGREGGREIILSKGEVWHGLEMGRDVVMIIYYVF